VTGSHNDVCPHCGGELRFSEKDTSSGREFREYVCKSCGRSVVEDRGKALWQILSDAREELERKRAEEAARKARSPGVRLKEAFARVMAYFGIK